MIGRDRPPAASAGQALGDRPQYRYRRRVEQDLRTWARAQGMDPRDPRTTLAYITQALDTARARLAGLNENLGRFEAAHERAEGTTEKRRVLLDFARALGAGRLDLLRDRLAMRRWFGFDALIERHGNRVGETEMHAVALADKAGEALVAALDDADADDEAIWRRIDPERVLRAALSYTGDPRVPRSAFRALAGALHRVPAAGREPLLSHETARLFYQAAQDPERDVWLQCEALDLLATTPGSGFKSVTRQRIANPGDDPDLFVRGRLVGLLRRRFAETADPEIATLWAQLADDPSTHVRQSLCGEIAGLPDDVTRPVLTARLSRDPRPEVRAAAALALSESHNAPGARQAADALAAATAAETNVFVLRCLVQALGGSTAATAFGNAPWRARALGALDQLHVGAAATLVRREAGMATERLRMAADPAPARLHAELRVRTAELRPGKRRRLPRAVLKGVDDRAVGRVLAVLAQDDFSYEIGRGLIGPWVRRGETTGFRLWRLLFELRRPSPDKRQGYGHTRGRIFRGRLVAPSAILAELSPTKVPGEPLFLADEGGWRPYLPLPDHAVSAVDSGRALRLFTAEGETTLEPPRGLVRALMAKTRLSLTFDRLATARNWTHATAAPPHRYAEMLSKAHLGLSFSGYADAPVDDRARRFFTTNSLGVLGVPYLDRGLLDRFQTYFFSVYQNSLRDLLLFLLGAGALFLARRVQLLRRVLRSRRNLPLVLGGWGTRGKSGTERLKAALMNALGYAVFSKTTGCEAMFVFAPAHRHLREMFLFRPYDKATIWEQASVTRLADRLGADVFLWECMGLTPSYVRILQSQWMRDDLSTITNAYPDHEDIQGPAGRDIPYVMTEFIPKRGRIITSEEQMRPILAQAAHEKGTAFDSVGWMEAGLIPDDVLSRFPYDEHPFNIALVTRMAHMLGVPGDFALKEMAERVVPDLGVLKTFPDAPINARRLKFVNGMSANERVAALNNWIRMGFDTQDPETQPGVVVTTVVNNRADRVPRSRVFADMLVNDMAADRHVLIGGNLTGLTGYIEEAMESRLAAIRLWPGDGQDPRPAQQVLADAAKWLRVVRTYDDLVNQLQAALPSGLDAASYRHMIDDPARLGESLRRNDVARGEEIAANVGRWLGQLQAYEAMQARVAATSRPDPAVEQAFRQWWMTTFRNKIVVVDDYDESGDAIARRIADLTAPGHLNWMIGVQNIKGTGLDFVYKWQAWENAYVACQQLNSSDQNTIANGLRRLVAFRDHGVLTRDTVRKTVESALERPDFQTDARQAALRSILESVTRAEARDVAGSDGRAHQTGRGFASIFALVEGFLDAGDAVRRRRKADQVYRDLTCERIGYDRAAGVLLDLTKRQKGGWLTTSLAGFVSRQHRKEGARSDPTRGSVNTDGGR